MFPFSELLRQGECASSEGKGGRCELRQVQVAAPLLQVHITLLPVQIILFPLFQVLRGLPLLRSQPAQERRHHRRQLDGGVRGGRPGAGPAGALLPGDNHRLQSEVSQLNTFY